MIIKYLIVLLISLSSTLVYSGTIRHDKQDSDYVNFGKKFYCVKQLRMFKKGIDSYWMCSCVVLNKHWIITSAHISHESNFDAIFVIINDKKYCIDKIILHKNFNPTKMIGDLALGYSKEGFGDNIEKPKLRKDPVELGSLCAIAGYGLTGDMLNGASILDNQLRAGSNRIYNKHNDTIICKASKDKDQTLLEFLPNVGDSGGGLFINGELAGITSAVIYEDGSADSNYGDEAMFLDITQYIEWINENVQ